MLDRRRGFFPDPHGEQHSFENLAAILSAAFTELDGEHSEHGNSKEITKLSQVWGRRIMLALRDAAIRYRSAGGKDFTPVRLGEWEVKASITEVYETDEPHLSVEIYRRTEEGRQEFKLSVSTFDGMRDEGMFPPKLEGTVRISETIELRYQVFLPWNRIGRIERTEVKDSPQFDRSSLYVRKSLEMTVFGPDG